MDKIENPNFSFKEITKPFVLKEIKNFNPKKTAPSNDIPIPTKLIREYFEILTTIIIKDFKKCKHNGTFPKGFKTSEYTFKSVQNYMNDESYMHDEINAYFDYILSNFVAFAKAIAHSIASCI